MPEKRYTTCFGAIVDAEINEALRAGMELDRIAHELLTRYLETITTAIKVREMRENGRLAA